MDKVLVKFPLTIKAKLTEKLKNSMLEEMNNGIQQAQLEMALEGMKMMADMFGSMADMDGLGDMFSTEMLSGMLGIAMDGNYITIEVLEESYSADEKTADVTIRLTSGQETITDTIKMVEISDQWYLDESVTGDIAEDLLGGMGMGF